MSQNDLVIANQTFPATRADINSALQALGSLNSGSSAPPTTYANMLWYDTANNTLKMRTEANDQWISLGYLDQSAVRFEPANAIPVGSVNTFAMVTAPEGWLGCDGSAVSRSTYSLLYSAIGTTYGVGDGSTTFNLPDLRGEFVRGLDSGRGIDSGRSIGTSQATSIDATVPRDGWGTTGGPLGSATSGRLLVGSGQTEINEGLESIRAAGGDRAVTTGSTGAVPRNVALLYCIKY